MQQKSRSAKPPEDTGKCYQNQRVLDGYRGIEYICRQLNFDQRMELTEA
ncbi:MAG: hypothetical protein LBV72_12010 [Tannerella sp.]|jgi:hypothetical protein|nr:hypothetical protein [Tannerella sp.]